MVDTNVRLYDRTIKILYIKICTDFFKDIKQKDEKKQVLTHLRL